MFAPVAKDTDFLSNRAPLPATDVKTARSTGETYTADSVFWDQPHASFETDVNTSHRDFTAKMSLSSRFGKRVDFYSFSLHLSLTPSDVLAHEGSDGCLLLAVISA